MKATSNVRYAHAVSGLTTGGLRRWGTGLLAALLLGTSVPASAQGPGEPTKSSTASAVVKPKPKPKTPAPVHLVAEPAKPPPPPETGAAEIHERLETRANFIRKGDRKSAEVELGHLLAVRSSLGNVNVPLASTVLLHEAHRALADGDPSTARVAAESASSLSPGMIAAHWSRFHACVGSSDVGCALGSVARAVYARFDGFRNQVSTVTDLLGITILSILALALLFGGFQLTRYGAAITHDLAQRLPLWAGNVVAGFILVLALLAPLAFSLGLASMAALWLVTLMLYQSKRERVVSAVLLAGLAVSPVVLNAAAPLLMVHGSRVDDLARLASEAYAPEAEARLAKVAKEEPDYEASFLLARRAWANGELEVAAQWYRRALEARPGDVAAHNNLGMVLYNLKNFDGALEQWKAAGSARIEPILNAAALDLYKGRFEQAQTAIAYARQIDPERTNRFSEADTDPSSRLLAISFEQSQLWDRLFAADPEERSAVVTGVWARLGGFVPWSVFPIVVLVLGALAGMLGTKSEVFSTPCTKCGLPAHRKAKNGYCAQCQTIYLKAVAVEPAMRFQKEERIRKRQIRQRWSDRLISFVGGAAHVTAGRAIEGSITMAVFVGIAIHWLWMERWSLHPWAAGMGMGGWHLGVTAAACALIAFVSYRRAL